MATLNAAIKKALPTQADLMDHKEHCSGDPEKLASMGISVGHQMRIRRNDTQVALYTVSEMVQEKPEQVVRMGQAARQRLGTTTEFNGTMTNEVTHPSYSDTEAEKNSEFVERLTDNTTNRGLIVIAPHGGMIERYTDVQAEQVQGVLAQKGVSSWRCKGWYSGGGAFDRWHITSTDIHEASFRLLGTVINRGFQYSVAFHGFSDPEILIGGCGPDALKQELRSAIANAISGSGIPVNIASSDSQYGGDSPKNIVNRLSANGIQIEQSFAARSGYWRAIADAVVGVYGSKI